ncbi:MAG TPA: branched-chain amino acid transaminase [Limnochordia bacterium]|nr:branched-chain amino acid transaminase [Limnochordia bacterium]
MARYAFFEGKFVPLEEAKISVQTHAFLYGTGVFEGIRAYWVEEEEDLLIFRMREHYERLLNSCKILQIKPKYGLDELCQITIELLARNGDREDVYIRPVYYKSQLGIGVQLAGIADDFVVFSVPMGPYLDLEKGLRVKVTSWRHINDNAIPMRAKVNGAYVNAALAKSDALLDGYDESIFLTDDGHVSEGSAENLFIVRNGQLITPPVTDDILEGITRATVIELAREELGLKVIERPIDRSELYIADEAFFVGTGAQVAPIAEIDRRTIGDGRIGPISRKVQQLYFDVVKGRVPKYRHWCQPVRGASR